jgi:hypothetical protein
LSNGKCKLFDIRTRGAVHLVGDCVGSFFGGFVGAFIGGFVGGFMGGFVGGFMGGFVGGLFGGFVGVFRGAAVGALVGASDVTFVIVNFTWNGVPAVPVAPTFENGVAVTVC